MQDYYWLNKDSRTFLSRDYLKNGQSPEERIREIAETAENILGFEGFADKFEKYMKRGFFSLSTPVWSNFGNNRGLGASCFNSYVSDDIDAILEKVAEVGKMSKVGGGTSGFFGELRPRGAKVAQDFESSGPVHFMELFDKVTEVISQGSQRRGAFAAYLPIEHPDIMEFLEIRENGNPIQRMSIGVTITDEWMTSMVGGDKAKRKIWGRLIKKRFESGYPYIIFHDTVNRNKPQVYKDKELTINGSNLCCVAGDQIVPTNFGLLTAKELHELGLKLTLADFSGEVKSSEMFLIKESDDLYKITLSNGMTHTVTMDHKIPTYRDGALVDVELKDLKVGDKVETQSVNGPCGQAHDTHFGYSIGYSGFAYGVVPDWLKIADAATLLSYVKGFFKRNNIIGTYRNSDTEKIARFLQIAAANVGKSVVIRTECETITVELLENAESAQEIVSIEYAETGPVYCVNVDSESHHWICNGVLTHNSEIMLPSSKDESFVCVLSSLNLARWDEIEKTDAIETLIMFLDAVNEEFVRKTQGMEHMSAPHKFAKNHRALGMGVLGWHTYLQSKMIPFEGFEAKMENARIFQTIQERAERASRELASLLGEAPILSGYGLRNTTLTAIAPTTSSSFILGQVSQGIEPINSNYFVKNLAKGSFSWKNPHLEELLTKKGKNNREVWKSILESGGSVQHLDFLDEREKSVFKTFGEISQLEIIQQAAQRQQWIDQSQSLNLMIHGDTKPKVVSDLIIEAWKLGVKSLYYQRSTNPSQELSRNIMSCKSCEG